MRAFEADLPFLVHLHMLRHTTSYYLANRGEDTRAIQHYQGHESIAPTVRYIELATERSKNFWND